MYIVISPFVWFQNQLWINKGQPHGKLVFFFPIQILNSRSPSKTWSSTKRKGHHLTKNKKNQQSIPHIFFRINYSIKFKFSINKCLTASWSRWRNWGIHHLHVNVPSLFLSSLHVRGNIERGTLKRELNSIFRRIGMQKVDQISLNKSLSNILKPQHTRKDHIAIYQPLTRICHLLLCSMIYLTISNLKNTNKLNQWPFARLEALVAKHMQRLTGTKYNLNTQLSIWNLKVLPFRISLGAI